MKHWMVGLMAAAASVVGLGAGVDGAARAAEYEMKIGLANPAKDYQHSYTPFVVFAHEVEARSNGRISVELFPNAQLGGVESMVNQVRQNIIQGVQASEGHVATTYPPIQVLSIPYLFLNREVAWRALDGPFGVALRDDMAATTGLRPLFWGENGGFRHYSNSKKPVCAPSDMEGLKIRTMNIPLHLEIVKNLGASPTPIPWGELYTSLQTGVVDGQENSIATFMIPKLEEVQKYIVLDGHVYSVNALYVNQGWYQALPDDLKQVIDRSALIAQGVVRGLTATNEVLGINYLKERGVEICAPTAEAKAEFRTLTQKPALDWLRNEIDPKWVDGMVEAVAQAEASLGY